MFMNIRNRQRYKIFQCFTRPTLTSHLFMFQQLENVQHSTEVDTINGLWQSLLPRRIQGKKLKENTELKITYKAEMSFLLSKPWVTKFLQTSRTLPGCLSQFQCFGWSAQLQIPKQNKDNPNRAQLKKEINFVTKLKETRTRQNVSQVELAGLLGYPSDKLLCDFETYLVLFLMVQYSTYNRL